ncbi:SLC13 family permease [Cocleimonas sp. KMM 6892]|uniref:SLC13 family permease n=1 Tax=unclassified Cocleimonas TaxID=2639732 RepID=UPI002DB9E11E|nr:MULTISPECIES: SLC13 family permease [unclassified Cocleimonas]MEB8432970.1 SLC13 family permease [Cocleimonas sp. KMM 6892]MEC4716049.1 SLC13 family permease [Cocleimonas sp. KMM 6895]MEC4745510.1 SLC13 family permease [Cocleimonas sp. KMM 6896]
MTFDQMIISGILVVALLLFAWGRWRYDLVAMFCLIVAVLFGVIPEEEAFTGFGHSAVVTVAAVLILSQGLQNAGVVSLITEKMKLIKFTPFSLLATITAVVTVLSAFMNNVGALALMLPITMVAAKEYDIPPARLLMPLAFGSILGGLTTLIGTPPNIIIAAYRAKVTGEEYAMFDFSPVGVPVAIAGVLFIVFIGWRLIPSGRMTKNASINLFEINSYLTEIQVKKDSKYIGSRLKDLPMFKGQDRTEILGVATPSTYARNVNLTYKIAEDDIFIIRADPIEIKPLLDNHDFELLNSATHIYDEPDEHTTILMEGVITHGSPLVGRDIRYFRRLSGRSIALVGLARDGESVVSRLRQLVFKSGDVLLIQGHEETIDEQFTQIGLLPLAPRAIELDRSRKVVLAMTTFVGAIILAMTNLVSLPIAFILAVMVYVLTGIVRVREVYEQIDWAVLVLLAAMIPVGNALDSTHTTKLIAETMLDLVGTDSPIIVLTLILIITMLLSSVVNNAATALVMAPISVAAAQTMGVNIDGFLMAVAVGASCAFLTPVGHQSNTLVMGPGGYQFGDYWRMGLPLEILIIVITIPLILLAWPL